MSLFSDSSGGKTKAFGLPAIAAGLLALGGTADAKWTRTHAFDCKTFGGTPSDTAYALYNLSTTQEMFAVCPVSDTDYLRKGNLTTLNVHVWDGHESLRTSARACYSLYHTTGGACGAADQSPVGTAHDTLRPSLSEWHGGTTAHFGYVWVRVPRRSRGTSSLRGYFTAG
jgi:hypothetical protein